MQVDEAIRRQVLKDRHFSPAIFSGAAWNLILYLYAAQLAGRDTSVAAACTSTTIPTATALRSIDVLIDAGFVRRVDANVDMRRADLVLTDKAVTVMDSLLNAIETG